jgi:hypothetical protein
MNRIRAAVTARAEALKDLNPRVFGALMIAGGVLLIANGLGLGGHSQEQEG